MCPDMYRLQENLGCTLYTGRMSKRVPFLLLTICSATLFASCRSQEEQPKPPVQSTQTELTGSVTEKSGSLQIPGLTKTYPVPKSGSFKIPLPIETEMAGKMGTGAKIFSNIGCGAAQGASADAKGFGILFLNHSVGTKKHKIAAMSMSGANIDAHMLFYLNKAQKLKGVLECPQLLKGTPVKNATVRLAVDNAEISLNKGWNMINLQGSYAFLSGSVSVSATLVNHKELRFFKNCEIVPFVQC